MQISASLRISAFLLPALLAVGGAAQDAPETRKVAIAKAVVTEPTDEIPLPPLRPEYPSDHEVPEAPAELHYSLSDNACDARGRDACGDQSFCSRFYTALTEAACDCDPCYKSRWQLFESASFWIDSARTQNRVRFRWDFGQGMILPDRAEYFWARVGQLGPNPQPGSQTVNRLDYHELSVYTETAHDKFSFFTVTPYRSLYMNEAGHAAGFSDIQLGTKSMLHDAPLLQVTFQMTTTIPTANTKKGLGVGHVALEPALLFGLALTERNYLQAQVAEWIPLGGDEDFAGALLRWGVSLNHVTWRRDVDNMATINLDLAGWSFQDGFYTDPVFGPLSANNETYLYLGPGFRFLFCGKLEWGMGGLFALSERHFAENLVRTEFTMRY